jgi:hypothetical protein
MANHVYGLTRCPAYAGQLGSTRRLPQCALFLSAAAFGRISQQALAVICFPNVLWFCLLFRHFRPDRRGPIPRVTAGISFFGPPNAVPPDPPYGEAFPVAPGRGSQLFHVLYCSRDDLGSPYTPAVRHSRRATLENPNLTACLLAQAFQSLWLVYFYGAYKRSFSLTMSSNSSAPPDLRLPGSLHCPGGFRPRDATRPAPAPIEYLWRNTGLNHELSILSSKQFNFMSHITANNGR